MGVNLCGFLLKKELSISDLEKAFGKRLEPTGEGVWNGSEVAYPADGNIQVLTTKSATLVYHDSSYFDNYD